jgi:hypothetical protein
MVGSILMKAPIVVNEHGDVSVFETVEHASRSLEAIDVAYNEYVAYDSEGRLLTMEVSETQQVVFRAAETVAAHTDDLRRILLEFLSRAEGRDMSPTMKLGELVAAYVTRFGYSSRAVPTRFVAVRAVPS